MSASPARKLRRQVRRAAAKATDPRAAPTIRLKSGPMDGFLVTPDAPALRPDWYTTWPDSVAAQWKPGRYVETAELQDRVIPIWEWQVLEA